MRVTDSRFARHTHTSYDDEAKQSLLLLRRTALFVRRGGGGQISLKFHFFGSFCEKNHPFPGAKFGLDLLGLMTKVFVCSL